MVKDNLLGRCYRKTEWTYPATSRDAPQQIVKDTPANVSAAAAINLPPLESLRWTTHYQMEESAVQLLNPIIRAAFSAILFPYDQTS